MEIELVDLRDYPLPLFEEPISPLFEPAKNEVARRWAQKVESFDGYIFVTAEYNHGVPGALKNAIDYVAHVFAKKPAAYVGYGGVGAARAIEQLRLVNIEQQMAPLRSAVHIGGADVLFVMGTTGEWNKLDQRRRHRVIRVVVEETKKHETRLAQAGARIWEVPISYAGRTYAEGKKIGWRDGIAAFWHIVRFNLSKPVSQRTGQGNDARRAVTR